MNDQTTRENLTQAYRDIERKVINLMLKHTEVIGEMVSENINPDFFSDHHQSLIQAIFYVHGISDGKRLLTDKHYRTLLIEQGCKGNITIAMQVYHECEYGVHHSNSKDDFDLLKRQLIDSYVHCHGIECLDKFNQEVKKRGYVEATRRYIDRLQKSVSNADHEGGTSVEAQTTQELMAMSTTTNEGFIIEGIIARGCMTLLAGYAKAGKSTLIDTLLWHMNHGGEFVDTINQSKVLYLAEDPQAVIRHRIHVDDLMGIENVMWVRKNQTYKLAEFIRYLEQIERDYLSGGNYDLFIIDTLTNWIGMKNEIDNTLVAEILNTIKDFFSTRHPEIALLVVHHFGKRGKDDKRNAIERIRGASAFVQVPDMLIGFDRYDYTDLSNRKRVLHFLGRYQPKSAEVVIELPMNQPRYEVVDLGIPHEELGSIEGILHLIEKNGAMTLNDISEIMSTKSRRTLYRMLLKAEEDGELCHTGTGKKGNPYVYQIPQNVRWIFPLGKSG